MSYFAQGGKKLVNASSLLTPGTLSAVIFTPLSDEFVDAYSVVITTNDTATQLVTVSDGVTTLTYFVGGATTGNPPVVDQASVPVRFKKGTAITVTASAVTAAKTIAVNIRGLSTKS